jgi:predicted ABC-type exoprotein transport system permease subunit
MTTTRITTSKRGAEKIRRQKSKKKRRRAINIIIRGRMPAQKRKEEVSRHFLRRMSRSPVEVEEDIDLPLKRTKAAITIEVGMKTSNISSAGPNSSIAF